MTYREMAIETIKIACLDTVGRVEDIVPDIDGITDVDVIIHIPTLTDDTASIPEITIKTSAYTGRVATEKILDMLLDKKKPDPPPHLDKDGCVYWDSVINGGQNE